MANAPLDFGSYFDTQGANNILNKLMDFKANRWQNAVGQGYEGINKAVAAAQQREKQKQQQAQIQQLIQQMGGGQPAQAQPQSMGQIPSGQPMAAGPSNIGQDVRMSTPQSQPQQQQPDPIKMLSLYAKANPQGAQELIGQIIKQKVGGSQLNPLQQSQADYYKARTAALQGGGQQGSPAAYVGPDGDVSITPKPGYQPVSKQQLPYVGVSASTKAKNKAMSSRGEAMERGIDARQIDRLAQSVGVTSAQRNLLQQNNMRANRAIELAQKPMTWQEFGAVTTDAAAIMQGGSPQVQQLHEMSYPSWKQDLARAQTYMQSTPQATVPDEFKNRIIGMIQGIQQVDNRYLTKNAEFMQKMMAPTIRGGIGQFKTPIQDMTNTITETGGGQKGPTATGPNGQKVMWNGSQWVPQ